MVRVLVFFAVAAAGIRIHQQENAAVEMQLDDMINSLVNFTIEDEIQGGGCSDADKQIIEGKDSKEFTGLIESCARAAYSFWYNSFNHGTFASCVQRKIKVTRSCAGCLSKGPSYGTRNCKGVCMRNSCSPACKSCMEPGIATGSTCAGFTLPPQAC